MRFPRGLRALNHAQFRRFFSAQLLALTGSWMQTVAQSWLVLQLTNSPFRLGLIGTLQFAPVLLFSIFSGAVADRFPKRRILIATQAMLACQAAALGTLAWTGHAEYWHVGVLAVVVGLAHAIDLPARQSYVAEIVGREDLVNAVALNSAAFNAARIVGPAVAGVLIARFGVVPAFAMNSVGFVVVIAALATLTTEGRPVARPIAGVLAEIGEGIRYALATPRIRVILALLFVVSFAVFNFTVYVPLLARDVLGLGAQGFGFLMAALGVGAVAGALTLGASAAREPSIPLMFGEAAVACGGLLLLSAARHVPAAAALLVVIGFFGIMLVAGCNTALQLAAPDELRGRVMSLYTLIWGGVFPIGAFLVGTISEAWSVSTAFLTMGSFALVSLAALAAWWRSRH
ncbi:MAG: MFS transporter [Candidatus Rokubacteria bacterium]|nr:MFS transporter [Candidatus Rokubacteria bacterium]